MVGRPSKLIADLKNALGFPPSREYWRAINLSVRQARARRRARQKVRDKRRPKCRCEAYPWPHRPGGGFCRHPDPPLEKWKPKAGSRPYRKRYVGLRRQIARANGMHPIKDRAAMDVYIPRTLALAKHFKRQCPRLRYRNVFITETGIRGEITDAGWEWGAG